MVLIKQTCVQLSGLAPSSPTVTNTDAFILSNKSAVIHQSACS